MKHCIKLFVISFFCFFFFTSPLKDIGYTSSINSNSLSHSITICNYLPIFMDDASAGNGN